jgi:putative phosphoesterase
MRVAAIYDIHGNLPALDAVLHDIRQNGVDRLVVGGDVLPGPMPRETLDRLLSLDIPTHFIQGNGDRMVLEQRTGAEPAGLPEAFHEVVRWNARQLGPEHERRMAGWPTLHRTDIPELGTVLFCHATPRNDTEIFTRRTAEERLLPVFGGLGVSLVVCGHTHMQFDRTIGGVRVVNAGSVGMPFGARGACWLLLGPDVRFCRTSYDLAEAAERVRATAYPAAKEFATHNILLPPSEEEMLAKFAAGELK